MYMQQASRLPVYLKMLSVNVYEASFKATGLYTDEFCQYTYTRHQGCWSLCRCFLPVQTDQALVLPVSVEMLSASVRMPSSKATGLYRDAFRQFIYVYQASRLLISIEMLSASVHLPSTKGCGFLQRHFLLQYLYQAPRLLVPIEVLSFKCRCTQLQDC